MSATTLRALFADVVSRLKPLGGDAATTDARRLVLDGLDLERDALVMTPHAPVAPDAAARVHELVARRLAHEPVSRILGRRDFYGRTFAVTPDVLDPRPDTECLVACVLEACACGEAPAAARILDVGTGSGCLAVTLLAEMPDAHATAIDVSAGACAITRDNAKRHGVQDRLTVLCADAFAPEPPDVGAPFDVLVSNPPYIPTDDLAGLDAGVRLFDPTLALDGGADGLRDLRALDAALDRWCPSGLAVIEIGYDQGPAALALFAREDGAVPERTVDLRQDLASCDRCVVIRTRIV
ncbi:MAG: peptide chain release factor N(5)-glutamine methyltransferase [Pseudomonadota bacterium]